MRLSRSEVVTGTVSSSVIGLVVVAASGADMAATGLRGHVELIASLVFLLTFPAGILAALLGRLAIPFGLHAAFMVTGIGWMLLSFPYGVIVARGLGRVLGHEACRTTAETS